MNYIHTTRKLYTQSEKEELLSVDTSKERTRQTHKKNLQRLQELEMANTWIKETKKDMEEFQITHEDIKKNGFLIGINYRN